MRNLTIAACIMTTMLLAGSDGPYFPWANMAGMLPLLLVWRLA